VKTKRRTEFQVVQERVSRSVSAPAVGPDQPSSIELSRHLLRATLLCAFSAWCGVNAGEPTTPEQDLMARRVQPCTACHGEVGRATPDGYYPRIAGKPAGYLLNQMINFRDGRRTFPQMVYFMQLRGDADLEEVASYFARQRLPFASPAPPNVAPSVIERGRKLVFEGNATLHVPACRSCHGSRLLGVEPTLPGLLGVSADYLQAQLGAWRNGVRAAQAPDCMATIAKRLSPEDIGALGAWAASQRPPPDASADTSFEKPPPIECGSIPAGRKLSDTSSTTLQPPETAISRGQQLAILGDCQGCHTDRGGAPFAGGRAIVTSFGTFYTPNITPDGTTGIGQWSSDDFWRALHQGYGRDGKMLYPSFPYPNYARVTRADSDAIFEYLLTVAPVAKPRRAHVLNFPYDQRRLLAVWRALYFRPGVYSPDPAHDAVWNRGAYLVQGLAHCNACHEPRNMLGAPQSGGNPSGGLVLDWYAPSLSNPHEAGVQDWAVPDIVTLLKSGRMTGAHPATTMGPMAEKVYNSLQRVSDTDLQAMAVYLRSIPPLSSTPGGASRANVSTVGFAVQDDGQTIYRRECADCHGEKGEGHAPIGPPLAGNQAVTLNSATNAIRIVLFGGFLPGTHDNPRPYGMPPYYPSLSDEHIANVLTYIRTSWGNAAGPVSASEVAENRGNPLW
jgi:cytochrome c553